MASWLLPSNIRSPPLADIGFVSYQARSGSPGWAFLHLEPNRCRVIKPLQTGMASRFAVCVVPGRGLSAPVVPKPSGASRF